MINPRPKHFKAKTQNLRDPRNLQQSPFVSNGEVQGVVSQIRKYGQNLLSRSRDPNSVLFRKLSSVDKDQGLASIILRKFSWGEMSSATPKLPSSRTIKTFSFGDLTPKQAAEIIIKEGHFPSLQRELRKAGIVTNIGAQQMLLQSLLQARMDEIDAERIACQFPISREMSCEVSSALMDSDIMQG